MKFTLASIVFLLPLLVEQASAGVVGRAANQKAIGKNVGAASSSVAAVAASSAAAAAATGKAAAAAGKGAAAANSTAAAAAASNSTAAAAAASNSTAAAAASSGDAQTSLTLDPKVIATGFADDGQDVPTAGQVASLTSTNNFINFCLTVGNLPITNGQQIKTGSCNPAPMGVIAATTNMPSSKFTFPANLQNIATENTAFTITMALNHLDAGHFTNAQETYYAAPAQVNTAGDIIGHTHFVVEKLDSITQTTPNDPNVFAFFKGVNGAAVNGVVSADVTDGLPAGTYRLASINAAANHQPVLVAIAQHGSLDDMVYFTVGAADAAAAAKAVGGDAGAAAASNSTADAGAAAAAASAANATATATGAANATSTDAAGKGAAAAGAAGAAAGAAGAKAAGAKGAAGAAAAKGAAGAAAAKGAAGAAAAKGGNAAAAKGAAGAAAAKGAAGAKGAAAGAAKGAAGAKQRRNRLSREY